MKAGDLIKDYLGGLETLMKEIPVAKLESILDVLWKGYQEDRQIFIFGNGGCAAAAMHFACDMAKLTIVPGKKRFRVVCLSANVALLTAWANDTNYGNIYGEQLANLMNKGDVVFGLTGSGNSMNIINALKYANEHGGQTVTITGFDGGMIKKVARYSLTMHSSQMQQVEDAHMVMMHILALGLRGRVQELAKKKK
jgi:D-sedoheptulose 7-phosphate isomerase